MNHSNRVSIAGAGVKNRYKTIIPSALLPGPLRPHWLIPLFQFLGYNLYSYLF